MNQLIEALSKYQQGAGLSTCQLANKLGINFTHLYRLKSGERTPGAKVIRAIVRHLPQLKGDALISLSNNHPPERHETHQNGKLRRFRGWLRGLVRKFLYTDISIGD